MTEPATLRTKLLNLEKVVRSEFVERDKVIHTAVLALASRSHHFTKATPGTGKSALVKRLVSHIGGLGEGDYFERLLTRFTNYSELFGAVDVLALQEGRYRLITRSKLPEAKFAFLDESFKASSSILNALLKILNEREFENEFGEPIDVPLSSAFMASNELPESDELLALWDRIHFRHFVNPIRTSSGFQKMLRTKWDSNPEPQIDWAEIVEIQNLVDQVEISKQVLDTLGTLRKNLAEEDVHPSDRRFMQALDVIRAEAFYNGREEATIMDMKPLSHVLWTHESSVKIVDKLIIELAAPVDRKAMDLLEEVDRLESEFRKVKSEADSGPLVKAKALEVVDKLKSATEEVESLKKKYKEETDKTRELETRVQTLIQEIMSGEFGLSVS